MQLINGLDMKKDLCNVTILSQYLTLQEGSAEKVTNALCQINISTFIEEFAKHLDIDAIFQ